MREGVYIASVIVEHGVLDAPIRRGWFVLNQHGDGTCFVMLIPDDHLLVVLWPAVFHRNPSVKAASGTFFFWPLDAIVQITCRKFSATNMTLNQRTGVVWFVVKFNSH